MTRQEARNIKDSMPDVPASYIHFLERFGEVYDTPAIFINKDLWIGYAAFNGEFNEYYCRKHGLIKDTDIFYANVRGNIKKMIRYQVLASTAMREHVKSNHILSDVYEIMLETIESHMFEVSRINVSDDFFAECNGLYRSYKDAMKLAKKEEDRQKELEEKKHEMELKKDIESIRKEVYGETEETLDTLVDKIEAMGYSVTLRKKISGG